MSNPTQLKHSARSVIDTEIEAIQALHHRIDDNFARACQLLLACRGRIIVLGLGKSGHIGNKIAATLASTGSPAFFVHAGEANHGDLGMITENDVVFAVSNSGETGEIVNLLPIIKRLAVPMIALTGRSDSTLATYADIHLDISVDKEACPLGLAPTASTTATLVMGDAIAIALLDSRGFTPEDFARSHPGGQLGKRLLLRASDIMHTGSQVPVVDDTMVVSNALVEMTAKGLGMTVVCGLQNKIVGIFTDGDLRRVLAQELDIHNTPIREVMTTECKTVLPNSLAAEVLSLMQRHKINALPISDTEQKLIGAINMHDLLRAGVV